MINESRQGILRKVPGNVPKKVVRGLCHRYKQDEKVFTEHPRALAKNQIKFLRMKKLPLASLKIC